VSLKPEIDHQPVLAVGPARTATVGFINLTGARAGEMIASRFEDDEGNGHGELEPASVCLLPV
jgi:hypothetical protein